MLELHTLTSPIGVMYDMCDVSMQCPYAFHNMVVYSQTYFELSLASPLFAGFVHSLCKMCGSGCIP